MSFGECKEAETVHACHTVCVHACHRDNLAEVAEKADAVNGATACHGTLSTMLQQPALLTVMGLLGEHI